MSDPGSPGASPKYPSTIGRSQGDPSSPGTSTKSKKKGGEPQTPISPGGKSRKSAGSDEEDDLGLGVQSPEMMRLALGRLEGMQPPVVPDYPAPFEEFPRTFVRIPFSLIMPEQKTSSIGRMLNSTVGRHATFILTLISFIISATMVVQCQKRDARQSGESWPMLVFGFAAVLFMYTIIPKLATKAGIQTSSQGVDWKPYFVIYRCAFLCACPALILLGLGYGSVAAFGTAQGPPGTMRIEELMPSSGHYFEASDGYVAMNLTKGIAETLRITEHGADRYRRSSRFKDAELRINTEPYSDMPEPTEPPGMMALHRIAPIFRNWEPCVSRYRISAGCLMRNPIVGWAVSSTDSLCSDVRVVHCKAPHPILDPVYECTSGSPKRGSTAIGPVTGLCGRIVNPPSKPALDELTALLMLDGWPAISMPNASHAWVNVAENVCISDPDACISQWNMLGHIGMAFACLTCLCIMGPALCDWVVDKRLRSAMKFFETTHRQAPTMV